MRRGCVSAYEVAWSRGILIHVSGRRKVLTDPFGSSVPYPLSVECDAVTVSHEHHDHNEVGVVRGPRFFEDLRARGKEAVGRWEMFPDRPFPSRW